MARTPRRETRCPGRKQQEGGWRQDGPVEGPSKALVHIQWKNQKFYRQATTKRIQHHQTSFTTNAKGTSLGGKEKATTRNKKIKNGKAHQ